MIDQELKADLIEVIETGTFRTEHTFQFGRGVLGVLKFNSGRSEGEFIASDGTEYQFKKTTFWKSNYVWKKGESILASAAPRGKLTRAFIIDFQGSTYGLFPGGSKPRSWKVKNISEKDLCEIMPRGAFKRGAHLWIRDEIPIDLLIFCYSLVSRCWQEQSS